MKNRFTIPRLCVMRFRKSTQSRAFSQRASDRCICAVLQCGTNANSATASPLFPFPVKAQPHKQEQGHEEEPPDDHPRDHATASIFRDQMHDLSVATTCCSRCGMQRRKWTKRKGQT